MRTIRMIPTTAVVAAVIALAACNRAPTPAQTPASESTAAPSTVAAPVAAAGPAIWFEPASVDTCDGKAVAVTVHWNARSVPGVRQVEVRPLGPGGKESLFMLGGAFGSRETGQWMTAGRTIILRNHADGSEIGRARLAGAACPK